MNMYLAGFAVNVTASYVPLSSEVSSLCSQQRLKRQMAPVQRQSAKQATTTRRRTPRAVKTRRQHPA